MLLHANGFGPTDTPVTSGAEGQSGNLVPLPVAQIGGVNATVTFAGLTYPGEFQLNVQIPTALGNGDQPVTVTYNGQSTQPGALITIHK